MTLPFSLFLALKYLKPKRTFLSVVTVISIIGVLLGVAVLIIVLSVMSGFDNMWRDKIMGFNAHIIAFGQSGNAEAIRLSDKIESETGVTGAAPFAQGLVIVQCNGRVYTPCIRGVDEARESRVSRVPEHIVAGKFSLNDDEAVIGRDLALRIGARIGDKLLIFAPRSFTVSNELRLPEELTVSGIFDLGMWDFDIGFVLTSLNTASELLGQEGGVQGIQIMTKDPYQAGVIAARIQEMMGYGWEARTWMEMNRELFAALRVEKNMMFFLLIFITIVAAFGIMNTLITLTVQKTKEVGLLKALGFSSYKIMAVFLWQGWISGFVGTCLGIVTGLVVLKYRNNLMHFLATQFNWELFPKSLYHLNEIPACTSIADVCLIALSVLLICTLAGVVPAYRAARLDPARALRYE